ncbi:Phosphoglycerate mutase [Ktedonobacter racemifer DSM 44963]|uniref:Phosphoglycerate mutase n=2 Tax=Ktedonobacter racemifer TaxID=363277 RepID=D6U4E5_KTERA|nr:Phosphoglycerate mutase [Ktedonobacter racemifer DSM 44963]
MVGDVSLEELRMLRRPFRLWLVRHGVTQWSVEKRYCGWSDPPLVSEGEEQARWLAQRFKGKVIAKIYSSDTQRAVQTAEIISRSVPGSMTIEQALEWREMHFGAWEGLTYEGIMANASEQPGFFRDPVGEAPPGGESFEQLVTRVRKGLRKTFMDVNVGVGGQGEEQAHYVLVSHGGPLRVLFCLLLASPVERQWQFRLDPGSLSAIDLFPGQKEGEPLAAILVLLNEQR